MVRTTCCALVPLAAVILTQACSSADKAVTPVDGGASETSPPGDSSTAPGDSSTGADSAASDAASDAVTDSPLEADSSDAGTCSLPPASALAVGEASGSLGSYNPPSTFQKAIFAADTRVVDQWIVIMTNDPDPCTTLAVAPVAPANCVSTPAAYQYLLARYVGASIPIGTDSGGSAYSFGSGAGYFSQGLTGSYVVDSQIDSAATSVRGRFYTCDNKTSTRARGTFNAAYCALAYFPCNS